jgi:hypothetical protein
LVAMEERGKEILFTFLNKRLILISTPESLTPE